MTARVAIYYAPLPNDPLTAASAAWLGRDPITNAPVPQPDVPDINAITAEPRRYGFHATLKPPLRLTGGWRPLMSAVRAMAAYIAPFDLPQLAVADLRGFLALRETAPCPPLQALADACVEQLDSFRQPPTDDELASRRRANLSAEQEAMLVRWGYPYVFESWFFHMTLTRRLSDAEKSVILPAAEAWFAPALAQPRRVEDICLFTQAAPGASFTLAERIRLRG
ncbi:MAG TPA: phosphonate metabolism protein [Acetobacteraceae bacterium]|jgi:putative phosphonate metabolism protein|nr:phosphonate metabolism protein [Acetobacteraceae bacterium]